MEKLLDFVTRNFQVEREDIELDKSLIDEGIIDSFGLVEIAGFITKTFDIVIEDDDMQRDNFGSVLKIVAFICRKVKVGVTP
jgi:acyl carrier protein